MSRHTMQSQAADFVPGTLPTMNTQWVFAVCTVQYNLVETNLLCYHLAIYEYITCHKAYTEQKEHNAIHKTGSI